MSSVVRKCTEVGGTFFAAPNSGAACAPQPRLRYEVSAGEFCSDAVLIFAHLDNARSCSKWKQNDARHEFC